MGSSAYHCPFLNRRDARCGEHLKLDELRHAFQYCFGRPDGCPVFVELSFERRVRQVRASKVEVPLEISSLVQINLPQRSAATPA